MVDPDLLGHLASCETTVVALLTGQPLPAIFFEFTDHERNAVEVARKRGWSVNRIRRESTEVHNALLKAIRNLPDDRWTEKIPSRSADHARSWWAAVLTTTRRLADITSQNSHQCTAAQHPRPGIPGAGSV